MALYQRSTLSGLFRFAMFIGMIAIFGCDQDSPKPDTRGTRLAVGTSEIFHTPEIDSAEAKKLGDVLIREKYFDKKPASVQIRLVSRRYELRLLVRPGVESQEETFQWRVLGDTVAKECFHGSPVDVHLCDDKFTTLKVVVHEPIKPDMPLTLSFRSSIGGTGLVARYQNQSDKFLTVSVLLKNATVQEAKTFVLEVGPDRSPNTVGWRGGTTDRGS